MALGPVIPNIKTNTSQIHATVAENRTSSELNRFLANCITNTFSLLSVPDRIFADHNCCIMKDLAFESSGVHTGLADFLQAHPPQSEPIPIRFYDNRQKYLAFVNSCNENPRSHIVPFRKLRS